ncbi:activator of Hsp90 ATPase [Flammula alnicola]|nr:activator of Hsp90 ATPase [Flammula alnicola]
MALPPSTANWHWKNKNITRWGTEWFERELPTISVTGDNEGEVLGQRKSKLITIFDCKIVLKWEGTASDGSEVKGTLTIPEVSHEILCDGLSEFVYNWTLLTDASPEVNALFALARTRLSTALEAKLATFPSAIIDTHGKDLTVSADPSRSAAPSNANVTPTPAPVASSSSSSAVPSKPKAPEAKKVNVTTVVKRIPAWTRAPAQSQGQPGTEYSLFGGGKEIVQTWALQSPTWPSGHEATLTTTLDQSSESTKVVFSLVGVPLGREEEIKRNIEGYYIHGFKSIGLGTEL